MDIHSAMPATDQDSLDAARQLATYINRFAPEAKAKQLEAPPRPDDAGIGVLTAVLQVVLGKNFVDGVLTAFQEWLKHRAEVLEAKKVRIQLTAHDAAGKEIFTVLMENVRDVDKVLEKLESFKS